MPPPPDEEDDEVDVGDETDAEDVDELDVSSDIDVAGPGTPPQSATHNSQLSYGIPAISGGSSGAIMAEM